MRNRDAFSGGRPERDEPPPIQRGRAHFVRLTARFCAAAVVGGRGGDEAGGAGARRVLAVARTLEGVAAICLFHRQPAVRGTR